jgi:O-methyltransferase involved in polyketide biosynthesis
MSARGDKAGDLSVTALYTAEAWRWGGFEGAELLANDDTKNVFNATNAALGVAGVFKRDARSLKHGLVHRHAMIDHVAREAGVHQVLEIAAGLSQRGIVFSRDPSIRYTEVDFAHVIAKKRALLERSDEGRAALARENLRLVEGDALAIDLAALVDRDAPLVVIAEGLLMYLEADAQRRLFAKVRALFGERGGVFVFDLVPTIEQPAPGVVGGALGWMMKRFTGGKTFERDERTRGDLLRDLDAAGFLEARAVEPAEVAADWKLPHPEVETQQLVFIAKVGH